MDYEPAGRCSPRTSAAGAISTAAWLRETFGVRSIMDNDANVGALGEAITARAAAAAALLHDSVHRHRRRNSHRGGVYRGADSYAGEIGHVTIRPDGPECLCGSAAVSSECAPACGWSATMARTAQELMQDPAFVAALRGGSGQGLESAIMLLNPARIVIGGGISKAGDALFVPLRAEWAARSRLATGADRRGARGVSAMTASSGALTNWPG